MFIVGTLENAEYNKEENGNHSKPFHPRQALRDLSGVFFYAYKYMQRFSNFFPKNRFNKNMNMSNVL